VGPVHDRPPGVRMPHSEAMALAVSTLSPVTMRTCGTGPPASLPLASTQCRGAMSDSGGCLRDFWEGAMQKDWGCARRARGGKAGGAAAAYHDASALALLDCVGHFGAAGVLDAHYGQQHQAVRGQELLRFGGCGIARLAGARDCLRSLQDVGGVLWGDLLVRQGHGAQGLGAHLLESLRQRIPLQKRPAQGEGQGRGAGLSMKELALGGASVPGSSSHGGLCT